MVPLLNYPLCQLNVSALGEVTLITEFTLIGETDNISAETRKNHQHTHKKIIINCCVFILLYVYLKCLLIYCNIFFIEPFFKWAIYLLIEPKISALWKNQVLLWIRWSDRACVISSAKSNSREQTFSRFVFIFVSLHVEAIKADKMLSRRYFLFVKFCVICHLDRKDVTSLEFDIYLLFSVFDVVDTCISILKALFS